MVLDGIDSLPQCQEKCKITADCKVWTYNKAMRTCYMKNSVQSTQPIIADSAFTLGQKYCPSKSSVDWYSKN